jgi:hypothetical protein
MRNILALTAAAAALSWAAVASAQDTQLYVTEDASGNRMIMGGTEPAGAPLLDADGDTAPGDCPEGSYWVDSQQRIHACQGEDVFTLQAPEAGAMMPDGQPFPENTMFLVREGTEDAGGTGAASGDNAGDNQANDRQEGQRDNVGGGGQQGGGGAGGGQQGGGGAGGGQQGGGG